ncbi:ribosomal RNA small subunit methyltransferase E [Rhodoferax lithotrophicus]|uniref:Ribosomal RNA small subunit methyltransferase E n=1 Tax=Rhodoferax lithotrophicus TaxID=2798804 RepID=A0ABM7MGG4_9BURK|nr:16S rRNA (uracil(1498)-N(3))-methyltransferase [Rhodoferax sp. MIZ03]BCO25281.1 ribosomal RNA small subunit methyltransferase E [Rhodoferax sp. MIZ03]
MPRFYCPAPLASGAVLDLPEGPARHVQVLRLQPGDAITLFNGQADAQGQVGEWAAQVTHMGRSSVQVQVGEWTATQREARYNVHLAVGMPANERMDWLVEKAAELGVTSIQPLMTERSVLRLSGERASKKQSHWQSVAVAACEQCGGNQVPVVHEVMNLAQWLKNRAATTKSPPHPTLDVLLSLRAPIQSLREQFNPAQEDSLAPGAHIHFLSGPEGGLSAAEEDAALAAGFQPTTLGPRVLRAETAALAVLATLLI